MSNARLALRARYVLPVCGPPIADGVVVIEGTEIAEVGTNSGGAREQDLGDVLLLPGFVNAHTHLEFSDLAAPLGAPGSVLPDWIREVIGHRRGDFGGGITAVSQGLLECLAAGSTTIGEIATFDWRSAEGLPNERPNTVMFFELIGPTIPRAVSRCKC